MLYGLRIAIFLCDASSLCCSFAIFYLCFLFLSIIRLSSSVNSSISIWFEYVSILLVSLGLHRKAVIPSNGIVICVAPAFNRQPFSSLCLIFQKLIFYFILVSCPVTNSIGIIVFSIAVELTTSTKVGSFHRQRLVIQTFVKNKLQIGHSRVG